MNTGIMILLAMGLFTHLDLGSSSSSSVSKNVHIFQHIYWNMREQSVRFLVRNHYTLLKKDSFRQTIQKFVSKYYDSVYHYYSLTDEEREFLESITSLMM
jgi:hypothetical protein